MTTPTTAALSPRTWTARDVKSAIYRHWAGKWAVLTEVTTTDPDALDLFTDRRIDVLCVQPGDRLAVEVKVSRGDFLQDVRDPAKQAPWRACTHRFAYAVPEGLVRPDEVPAWAGLLVVRPGGRWGWDDVLWAKRAPRDKTRVVAPLPDRVWQALAWRAATAEAHAKGLVWGDADGSHDPEVLRGQVQALLRDKDNLTRAVEREKAKAADWRARYALHDPPLCAQCGEPLRPVIAAVRYGAPWVHVTKAADGACEAARGVDVMRRRSAGDRYAQAALVVPVGDPDATVHLDGP